MGGSDPYCVLPGAERPCGSKRKVRQSSGKTYTDYRRPEHIFETAVPKRKIQLIRPWMIQTIRRLLSLTSNDDNRSDAESRLDLALTENEQLRRELEKNVSLLTDDSSRACSFDCLKLSASEMKPQKETQKRAKNR